MEYKGLMNTNSVTWSIDMDNMDEGGTLEIAEQQDRKSGCLNSVELSHPYAWKVMWERN